MVCVVEQKIRKAFEESIQVKRRFLDTYVHLIGEVANVIAGRLSQGSKVILFGNGGSASDAAHIAAEFVNRYMLERPPLPAIALNTDMSVITSIANDYDYKEIFAKQVRALGEAGDVAIAITTSGASANVLAAVEVAKKKKLITVGFTGAKGDKFCTMVDYAFQVPSAQTPRIQETHITLGHVLCQMIEEILFKSPGEM
jgi:D-sedoheptulose 7-phosphate isomerase